MNYGLVGFPYIYCSMRTVGGFLQSSGRTVTLRIYSVFRCFLFDFWQGQKWKKYMLGLFMFLWSCGHMTAGAANRKSSCDDVFQQQGLRQSAEWSESDGSGIQSRVFDLRRWTGLVFGLYCAIWFSNDGDTGKTGPNVHLIFVVLCCGGLHHVTPSPVKHTSPVRDLSVP